MSSPKEDESIIDFITRRMAEIEASGASEYLTGQVVAYSEVRKKVQDSLEAEKNQAYEKGKQDAFDSAGVLTGDAAKAFEEYQNRPATQEEIDYMRKAEEVYKRHSPEEKEKKRAVTEVLEKVKAVINEWPRKDIGFYIDSLLVEYSTTTTGSDMQKQ